MTVQVAPVTRLQIPSRPYVIGEWYELPGVHDEAGYVQSRNLEGFDCEPAIGIEGRVLDRGDAVIYYLSPISGKGEDSFLEAVRVEGGGL